MIKKPKETSEICLIAPTESLADRARAIIRESHTPILVYTAALDQAVHIAEELLHQGTWLFISRRGTRNILQRKIHATVVNIPVFASDYITALQRARQVKGTVAFFIAEEISDELQTMCLLLNIKMRCYYFTDDASCRNCVQQAIDDGAVLGIGGAVSAKYANDANMPYIVVESSDNSVRQSIETACQMAALRRENIKKQEQMQIQLERFENILNYTHDAILAVDSKGCIDVMNQVATRILNPEHLPYKGRPINEILPNTRVNAVLESGKMEINQLMDINGTLVSTNRVPITVNGEVKGAVTTFQDVKFLQNTERSIRIKLHKKGLAAKYNFSDIIGESKSLKSAKEFAENFADLQFTTMLYGETGTGKEMFAQSIHNAGPRKDGPFVAVNCTALSKSLLESELFGYADSSFTGAKRGGKAGLFELAHGGTIFLDEIGELPIEFQAQFLRVLQEKEVRRVGGDTVIPVDIRVIGATNCDLSQQVERGTFRRDLYYRLNVLNIMIPPLRERENDYLLIAESIYNHVFPDRSPDQLQTFLQIMERYRSYPWPGNVRELDSVVERACILQRHGMKKENIFNALHIMMAPHKNSQRSASEMQRKTLLERERKEIEAALEKNNGNISLTAKELNISRSTLYRKLKA